MQDAPSIIRAELYELDAGGHALPDSRVPVQFNPETLKVSFSNQVVPPNNSTGDQSQSSSIQYVGKGTTKLSVQLWFDVAATLRQGQQGVTDVRQLTKKVAYFITPKPAKDDPKKFLPPAVRFLWGTFQFDGIMDSLEESLEFFSAEGKPLRASVALSLSQQEIQFQFAPGGNAAAGAAGAPGAGLPGTRPLAQAQAGDTFQGLAQGGGRGGNWQPLAAANGIENPRFLAPGQLIDLSRR